MKRVITLIFLFLSFSLNAYSEGYPIEAVIQIGHNHRISFVSFSPNGKHIITGGGDNGVAILWDVSTGRIIRAFSGDDKSVSSAAFSPNGKFIITGSGGRDRGDDNTAKLWDIAAGSDVLSLKGHAWGITSINFSSDGQLIITGSIDNTVKLWSVKNGEIIRTLKGHTEDVISVGFSPDNKYIYSGTKNTVIVWNIDTGEKKQTFKTYSISVNISPDGKYIVTANYEGAKLWDVASGREIRTFKGSSMGVNFSPDGKYIITGSNNGVAKLWDVASGREIRTFKGYANSIKSANFSPDGKYIITGSGGKENQDNIAANLWNLSTGRKIYSFKRHSNDIVSVNFSPDGKYIVTGSLDGTARLWNISNGKEVLKFKENMSKINSVDFSPNGKYVAGGCEDGTIKLWEAATGNRIKTFSGHVSGVSDLSFSPDGRYIASAGRDNVRLWDVLTGLKIASFEEGWKSVDFSSDGKYIASGGYQTARIWDISKGKELNTLSGLFKGITSVRFSPDGKHIAIAGGDRIITLWNPSAKKATNIFKGHFDDINSVNFSYDGNYLITGSEDGTTKLWDVKSGIEIVTIITIGESDYAIISPDHYYTVSKGATKGIHFVKGLNIYTFDNFDLIFNRPDIILERLGKADISLINAYHKVYLKRLKKMGFKENQISTDMHLPEIEFINNDFPFETENKAISFQVKASDSKYKLDRINVYINDVPIYGVEGVSLRGKNLSTITKSINFKLSTGKNKVQISAHNEKGAESLKETFEINYTGKGSKPDLYLVAVGISDYANDDFDLTYAAKDATDIITLFKSRGERFRNINVLKILDKDATKENISKAKGFLMNSNVDDEVVFFIAGHALLDKNLDFYFAPTDLDFYNPSERGLPYEDIEAFLDGIPARKKLLLMDTCHSGEIDKEETTMMASKNVGEGIVKTRSFRGIKLVNKSKLGLHNSIEFLNELFSDLRRGSGAMVISATSGSEYAYESPEWKNGVFTYSILKGLETNKADKNKDGDISVSELRDYIVDKVKELTKGGQTPTMRRENLDFDFKLF